ncbi:MAG: exodeoxyribonuclease VII small subunit [Bacteroidetes bacterium]|nr:MAG: exodeoxyribonuclease VII small subunit [Bacteroidota bacterium]
MTYSEAYKELEIIVNQLENDEIPVEELLKKVNRSTELLNYCKSMLHQTNEDVKKALADLNKETKDDKATNE